MRGGESLGLALIHADVPWRPAALLLGHFVTEELADGLDRHYVLDAAGDVRRAFQAELAVDEVLRVMARRAGARRRSARSRWCRSSALLVVHGINHEVPLFLASFAGFLAALPAIARIPKMRALALREAGRSTPSTTFCFRCFCRSRC